MLAGVSQGQRRAPADQRRQIAALAAKTSPKKLWDGPFVQLGNSQVEAGFADHRTYFYKGKEVDQQVHLGFDLAVTAHVPVVAANAGTVLNASWLGIYGNCVDHRPRDGRAVAVRPPVVVRREGGRHGRRGARRSAAATRPGSPAAIICISRCWSAASMVNPVEWWDPHWIADRVERKLQEAR